MKNFHYRQACLYFIYKVISIEAPKSNFQVYFVRINTINVHPRTTQRVILNFLSLKL